MALLGVGAAAASDKALCTRKMGEPGFSLGGQKGQGAPLTRDRQPVTAAAEAPCGEEQKLVLRTWESHHESEKDSDSNTL